MMLTAQRQMDHTVLGIGLQVTYWLLRWPRSTFMTKLLTHLQTDHPLLVGVYDACLLSCPMRVKSCGPKTAAAPLNVVAVDMLLQA